MPPDTSSVSADQSVEELRRELAAAREQQAAASAVLRAISASRGDLTPIYDSILLSVMRLCEANIAALFLFDGKLIRAAAIQGATPEFASHYETLRFPPSRETPTRRAVLEGQIIHIPDVFADIEWVPTPAHLIEKPRTALSVPMRRDGTVIGTITTWRRQVRPFNERQIALIETLADQAVIAIENTRLLNELRESLQQQTATAEVLNVISRSKFNRQPVFDAIVASGLGLFAGDAVLITLPEGDAIKAAAVAAHDPACVAAIRCRFPVPLTRDYMHGIAILDRRIIDIDGNNVPAELSTGEQAFLRSGNQAITIVPLMRGNEAIGALSVLRLVPGSLTQKQLDLLQTFADQAVIAIENARLFAAEQTRTRELGEALEQQTATAEVLGAISRSKFELQPVLDTLVASAAHLCDAPMVAIHVQRMPTESAPATMARLVHGTLPGRARYGFSAKVVAALANITQVMGRGSLAGRTILERRPVHIPDVEADPEYAFHDFTHITGARSMLGLPLLRDGNPIGLLSLYRTHVAPFTERQIELLETFADQAVIAIENARLFEEVQERTRELGRTVEELENTSQHKSQFVANMSHELRTPLAAILGYAELMQEGFYEPLGEKSLDALTRIRSNGKHLLGLINTVLDIAKIESGQFTLNMAEYAMESVVETVRSATESLAQNKKLLLKTEVAKSLPIGIGDEQRLTQVLLNLVGNAIKFTDAGEVRVTATAVNGRFAVSVADTGPGIPEHERTRVFEQFHQIDNSNTKAKGGTGLGLAIAKQIVEMHGGYIWVESTVGQGSTFQLEIPTRVACTLA